MKLTDWFDRATKPVHVGAYEVRRPPNGKQLARWYSWWNGYRWSYTAQTPSGAESCKHLPSDEAQHTGGFEWRGMRRKKN